MSTSTAISFLATLGVGSLLGIVLKSVFDAHQNNKKMMFEARLKAYSGITSRIFNMFQEPDINFLSEELKFLKFNQLLSEVFLLGSGDLHEVLEKYREKLQLFHQQMDKYGKKDPDYDEVKAKKLNKEIADLAAKVVNQMRTDLYLEQVK